jgi:hypothetical protein
VRHLHLHHRVQRRQAHGDELGRIAAVVRVNLKMIFLNSFGTHCVQALPVKALVLQSWAVTPEMAAFLPVLQAPS